MFPDYLSDNSDIQDFEDYEAPNTNFRGEATWGPKETNPLPVQTIVAEMGPEPNLISYGTNFDILLAEDLVHARILELVVENAIEPNVILYTKINLVKLGAINKAKASNLEDAELASMMTAVSLAQSDENARCQTQNNEEKIIRDCIDQKHWLDRTSNLEVKVTATVRKIIMTSHYTLPDVISKTTLDDLCGVLYAIISDNHHKTASNATAIHNPPETDHVSYTNSNSGPQIKPVKHVPIAGNRFGTNIITHLTLVGGLPLRPRKLYSTDRATFKNFMGKVSDVLKNIQSSHHHRLGVLTQQQMEHGNWLYQVAADMEKLDLDHTSWQVVDETSFKTFPFVKDTQVFLIHEYRQSMPARINDKVRSRPRVWNTWNLLVGPTLASPSAPEFVPCSGGILVAPVSVGMAALSKALPSSHADGRKAGKQQGGKKRGEKKEEEKEGEKKERRTKRYQQKVSLAFRKKVE